MVVSKRALLALSVFAAAGAAQAQSVLFDTGPANTSLFNGAATFLGWSSGAITSAGFAQRWTAQAFTLGAASNVTEIDVNGFVPTGSDITNLHYVIWRRNAGNPAPVAADQVVSGFVALPTPTPDPRVSQTGTQNGAGTFAIIPASPISLPAGNYYLTVYGGEPLVAGTDANFAWFTNAQFDSTLIPPNTPIVISDANGVFTWRSTAFPSPGFARYTTAAIAIDPAPTSGPGSAGHPQTAQDPQYLYNASFAIIGTPGSAPCYANCDNSTTAPILNVLDFNCFLNQFSAGASYANCDNSTTAPVLNVLDFNCFLNRFSAGCP